MIKDVEIRVATVDDIKLFYPDLTPPKVTAWVALYKGDVVCLSGVIHEESRNVPFSDVKPNNAPKLTVWRTVLALWGLIKDLGLPLETGTEGRCSPFLERLGFGHVATVDGWEMYRC